MKSELDREQNANAASKRRSVLWALLLHVALGLAVWLSWHQWSKTVQDDAAPAQVGLWTPSEIAAVPPQREQKQTKPKPAPKPAPQPTEEAADIHLGAKVKRELTPKPQPSPQPTAEPTPEPTPQPTHRPRPTPRPTRAPTPEPTATPKPDLKAEAEKRKAEQAAQAKARQEAAEKAAEKAAAKARQKTIDQLKKQAGQDGGSTTSAYNGAGKSAYKPSKEYEEAIGAKIRKFTDFDADSVEGRPITRIEIHLSPDGTVLGQPKILQSSGNDAWDRAAVAGIIRAAPLPRDRAKGVAPPVLVIDRSPK